MPPEARERLFGAVEDVGAFLGNYVRALLTVYHYDFESHLVNLFEALRTLHDACRAAGVPSGDYRFFERALGSELQQ